MGLGGVGLGWVGLGYGVVSTVWVALRSMGVRVLVSNRKGLSNEVSPRSNAMQEAPSSLSALLLPILNLKFFNDRLVNGPSSVWWQREALKGKFEGWIRSIRSRSD